ncbi:MAG: IS630 family transposase [Bacteroidetes bacterium]|nr:IS630 family transposase [Bacteroidota bacterium]
MIYIEFSEEEIKVLNYERYHYPHPKVQQKMEVLYLKAMGLSHQEICRLCGISHTTLVTYLKQYQEGGIERLKQLGYQGQPNELSVHEGTLKAYFKEHPPVTIAEAQAAIEKLTGIKRKLTQVRAFLKRIGMKCRKVGSVPGKALDPGKIEEQESFKKQELDPRLEEAKTGQRKVYFMDAAHFVFRAFLGFVWCFERIFIPSPSGRKRFNVLGALDAVTNELITITNDSYINSRSVCKMLDKIAQINQGLGIPISIFLDNARYQRCIFVQEYAAMYGIELAFLPSYSPNLNLIERYWKFLKKQCLYSKYYENFAQFKDAIQGCIENAHIEHKDKLESLLTWNFQSFKKCKFLAA